MPGIKKRGIQSVQNKRYYQGREVKPVRWVRLGGSNIMAGVYADNEEMVLDALGNPIPFKNIG